MPERCDLPYHHNGDLRACPLAYNHDADCDTANHQAFTASLEQRTHQAQNEPWL